MKTNGTNSSIFRAAVVAVLMTGAMVVPVKVRGDINSFTSLAFNPVPGRGPYLNLSQARVGEPRDLNTTFLLDYARTPFKADFPTGNQAINKRLLTGYFLFDVNLTRYLQAGFNFPVVFSNEFHSPTAPFPREYRFDLGDPLLMIKGEILDPSTHPIGLALIPTVTLPLGNGRSFTGTNTFVPGIKLAMEKKWKRVSVAFNTGYLFHKNVIRAGINVDDMITYDLGASFDLTENFSLSAEFNGRTVAKDAFASENQSPAQGTLALKARLTKGFSMEAGTGFGILRGVGSPAVRGFIGITCNQNCFKKKRGSAETPTADLDGDGVDDQEDQCPGAPGSRSDQGCPPSDIKVTDTSIETPPIHFATARANIQESGEAVLDRLVEAVKARPRIKKVRIQGHTDSIGNPNINQCLSLGRANAIRSYLQPRLPGIPIDTEGYGSNRPIADNRTAAGRAKNRRVEFLIVDK